MTLSNPYFSVWIRTQVKYVWNVKSIWPDLAFWKSCEHPNSSFSTQWHFGALWALDSSRAQLVGLLTFYKYSVCCYRVAAIRPGFHYWVYFFYWAWSAWSSLMALVEEFGKPEKNEYYKLRTYRVELRRIQQQWWVGSNPTHRGFLESAHAFWCTIFFVTTWMRWHSISCQVTRTVLGSWMHLHACMHASISL